MNNERSLAKEITEGFEALKSMRNNEPVAWIAVGDNTSVFFNLDCALSIDDNPTPLYTHPVKELTDEEILKLYVNNSTYDNDQKLFIDIYGFARAILRKAQEK